MAKLLLTGASGFIGSRIVQSKLINAELVPVSLRTVSIKEIDFNGITSVLHLAGLAHQMTEADEDLYFHVNKDLSLALAKAAKASGVKQFIYISTTKVYGDGDNTTFYNESSPCYPTDAYGRSKLEAEIAIQELHSEDFTVSIIRPPLVYGPGVKGNLKLFIKLAKLPILLPFKDVNNNRAMVYVDNLISMIDKVLVTRSPGIFTLTDHDRISTEMLMTEIRRNLGKRPWLVKIPRFGRKALAMISPASYKRLYGSFNVDCAASLKELKYKNPTTFKEGIKAMVQFDVRQNA